MVDKPNVLEFKNVSRWFERRGDEPVKAVNDLSFRVPADEDGEFLAIVGPSGCGKSTMLNMIAGLDVPSAGEISIQGERVFGHNSHTVTVQQAYTCLPWRTVLGNVMFGLEIEGKSRQECEETARKYLDLVQLGDRADAYPKEISGGMQQRVAIARALALRRPVLLMDEPFGALDAQTRADMQRLIVSLWQQEKSLILFVTHDIVEALMLADRIIVLSARPATIVLDTKVSFTRPRTLDTQSEPNFQRLHAAILGMLKGPNHEEKHGEAASR